MMRTTLLNILLLLSVFLAGCKEHPEVSASLDRAEALMESAPDSALTLLQNLDAETFRKRSTHARHALLYTQAQDKNYIDETNDSLITVAADYFRNHGDVRSRFLSLYYKGRTLTNAGDRLNAMLSYAEAEELVPQLHDDYYAGLLYTQMGDLYREFYDFPKSLEAYRKASEHYHAAGKELHRLYALSDYANACRNVNEYTKSDSLLRKVWKEAENGGRNSLVNYALSSLVMQYVEQERMQEAYDMYKDLVERDGIENNTSSFMASVVKIHLSKGDILEAERMLQQAWIKAKTANDSISCHLVASEIYQFQHYYDKALQEHTTGVLAQNRIVIKNLEQPVLTIQRDYLKQELEYKAYRVRMESCFRRIGVIFFLMMTVFLVVLFRYKMKKKEQKVAEMLVALEDLQNALRNNDTKTSALIWEMFSNHLKFVDHLSKPYLESSNEDSFDKCLRYEVNQIVRSYAGGDGYQEMEKIVNQYNDNVMTLLRNEIQLKTEQDYQLICYQLAGFTTDAISVFVKGISSANIYQKRSRLRKIIMGSNAPHRDLFLRLIYKSGDK